MIMTDYQVTVVTSDERGAGTGGRVYLQLFGDSGNSGETELANHRSNFDRAQVDVFDIKAGDLGPIRMCSVRLVRGRRPGGRTHVLCALGGGGVNVYLVRGGGRGPMHVLCALGGGGGGGRGGQHACVPGELPTSPFLHSFCCLYCCEGLLFSFNVIVCFFSIAA